MKKKVIAFGLAAAMSIATVSVLAGCGGADITISGSSSVSPLMEKLADAYMKKEGIKIEVITSDSSSGITDAKEGRNDFGMASRDLKSTETGVTSKKIATDGVAIIVNKDAALDNVTGEQVYDLYASGTAIGAITNAITREEGSGTRDAFDGLIQKGDQKLSALEAFSDKVSRQSGTGAVKTTIAQNIATLGYISLGSLDDSVKAVMFEGVAATTDNVKSGDYALSRPFNIVYTAESNLSEQAKKFIDFIMSAEGQAIVESAGYVSVV